MRNRFAQTFYELAQADKRLVCIVADISPAGAMDKLRKELPAQFINTGVAEQVMIGMAAGMSLKGMRPFCYTIATFALYRPFEMIRDDLAYQNLPVTVVGIGGGVAYSTLGATHHAMEDIAVASAIPNMTIIAPCDPYETEMATRWCATQTGGPVYLRLGKAGELTYDASTWEFGKPRKLVDGSRDLLILTYGPTGAQISLEVSKRLYVERRIRATVMSVHTLKPLNRPLIASLLGEYETVLVIEEMNENYGLGSWVRVCCQTHRLTSIVITFGLKDEFKHVYGSHQDVLKAHGLTADEIMRRI